MTPLPQRKPLSTQAAEWIRTEIAAGTWLTHLPGEEELARRLTVSRVTLRAALTALQAEGVLRGGQGKRREIVLAKPRKPKPAAISRVYLACPATTAQLNAFKLLWIDQLRDILVARGLEFHFVRRPAIQGVKPAQALRRLVADHPAGVWILLRASPGAQQWFITANLPAVVAGSATPDLMIPSVDMDYHASCRHAAGLLAARGCERLALITPREMLAGDRESEAGFLEGAGHRSVCLVRHDGTPDGLCRHLDCLLAQPAPPRGLFVLHSTHAVTTLTHLLKRGRQFPADFRLISRDDDPFLEHVSPTMALYTVAPEAYARRMAQVVVALALGEKVSIDPQLLIPDFVHGETLGT